jgi:hypothetical protein
MQHIRATRSKMFYVCHLLSVMLFNLSLLWALPLQSATNLTDIRPHTPTTTPWVEQWFYYITTDNGDIFKVSPQILLAKDDLITQPMAYVHFVHASPGKAPQVIDFYSDQLVTYSDPETGDFSYEIPGVVYINREQIRIDLPEYRLAADFIGQPFHYWPAPNEGRSPLTWLAEIPWAKVQYFVYSMSTKTRVEFEKEGISVTGPATTYLDKGIYTNNQSESQFVGGFNSQQQLSLYGGKLRRLPINFWALRYHSEQLDIQITPKALSRSVEWSSDHCSGELSMRIRQQPYEIQIEAKTDPQDFYASRVPVMTHFDVPYPTLKSMNAQITGTVSQSDSMGNLTLIETFDFPLGLLEFSDSSECFDLNLSTNNTKHLTMNDLSDAFIRTPLKRRIHTWLNTYLPKAGF